RSRRVGRDKEGTRQNTLPMRGQTNEILAVAAIAMQQHHGAIGRAAIGWREHGSGKFYGHGQAPDCETQRPCPETLQISRPRKSGSGDALPDQFPSHATPYVGVRTLGGLEVVGDASLDLMVSACERGVS